MSYNKNDYPQTLACYKNYKDGNGGAIQFKLSVRPIKEKENEWIRNVFIEAANQMGDQEFNWKNKIVMKLGLPDIGSIKAVLSRRDSEAKLFHKNPKGNTVFEIKEQGTGRTGYYMNIKRNPNEGNPSSVSIPLTNGEAENFKQLKNIV